MFVLQFMQSLVSNPRTKSRGVNAMTSFTTKDIPSFVNMTSSPVINATMTSFTANELMAQDHVTSQQLQFDSDLDTDFTDLSPEDDKPWSFLDAALTVPPLRLQKPTTNSPAARGGVANPRISTVSSPEPSNRHKRRGGLSRRDPIPASYSPGSDSGTASLPGDEILSPAVSAARLGVFSPRGDKGGDGGGGSGGAVGPLTVGSAAASPASSSSGSERCGGVSRRCRARVRTSGGGASAGGGASMTSSSMTSSSTRDRSQRRIESNERERQRMHSLNDAFQVSGEEELTRRW